ncbi:MAG TPA: FkbM family methyltransferase [Stellaceae bacterium]|nr:FkbM family methyltransferase [Stellaceae bacterium]
MSDPHLATADSDPHGKYALEAALRREPGNAELRALYRAALGRINRTTLGLSTIVLPELMNPLYFRCGSSDLANFDQIFGIEEFSIPFAQPPARILDLGAYVGYAAVYLAHRFPTAEIVCVEPAPANFKVLGLNTAPYPRIRRLNGAVWSRPATLSVSGHELGDWGVHFTAAAGDAGTPAWSVDEILRISGWDRADLIKCDIEGSEREVFADREARWHQEALCVTVETHDEWIPGCLATVEACFDPDRFDRSRSGELSVFIRRRARTGPAAPPRLLLLEPSLARQPIELEDVSDGIWGFMVFDEHSCQLHPNDAGGPPARLVIERDFAGHTRFHATVSLPPKARAAVRFAAQVEDPAGNRLGRGECVVEPGCQAPLELALPPLHGRHRVTLQTEMAEPAGDSFHAWAHWIAPHFM